MKKLLFLLLSSIAIWAQSTILAVQWFPSVCRVHHYKTCKHPLPFWQTHFTLHGLWPKKQYCNVPVRWKILDKKRAWKKIPISLDPRVAQLLETYMPGIKVGLQNHEYVKHGSCFNTDPNYYLLTSIALLSQLNTTKVRYFFLKKRNRYVSTKTIRKLFDEVYFKEAGKRVQFICKKGYLTELRINLSGTIAPTAQIYDLLRDAKPLPQGCKRGLIAR